MYLYSWWCAFIFINFRFSDVPLCLVTYLYILKCTFTHWVCICYILWNAHCSIYECCIYICCIYECYIYHQRALYTRNIHRAYNGILYAAHCISGQYSVQYTILILSAYYITLYSVQCTLYIVQCSLYNEQSKPLYTALSSYMSAYFVVHSKYFIIIKY